MSGMEVGWSMSGMVLSEGENSMSGMALSEGERIHEWVELSEGGGHERDGAL